MEIAQELAPTHFMGTAMTWGQYATPDEILRAAIRCMEQGAEKYHAESTAMRFPYAEQSITMHAGEEEKVLEQLDKL